MYEYIAELLWSDSPSRITEVPSSNPDVVMDVSTRHGQIIGVKTEGESTR